MNRAARLGPEMLSVETARIEAARCLFCADPPCEKGCPAGVEVRRFIRRIHFGDPSGALEVIRKSNPLAGTCGLVCDCRSQCERDCTARRRGGPVKIGLLQHFAAVAGAGGPKTSPTPRLPRGKKVAIVGSGPAGLSAAAWLAKAGCGVKILEKDGKPGGALRWAIPRFRLPSKLIYLEINYIKSLGVDILCGRIVRDPGALLDRFDAVFVAVGLGADRKAVADGSGLRGVVRAREILRKAGAGGRLKLRGRVVVVGGGNTAIDASRVALRHGASEVVLLYRRTTREMPAFRTELFKAIEEGVVVRLLSDPAGFTRAGGRLRARCKVLEAAGRDADGRRIPVPTGSEFDLDCDTVVLATGEALDAGWAEAAGLSLSEGGFIRTGGDFMTSRRGIFAGGDCIGGEFRVVKAVADGFAAARGIAEYFGDAPETRRGRPAGPDLSVTFCGKRFESPIMLAAAPTTDDLDIVSRGLRAGWAGAVLKTTSVESEPVPLKYPMMTAARDLEGGIEAMGNIDLISEHHAVEVERRLAKLKKDFPSKVIAVSIMGRTKEDWQTLAAFFSSSGADLIECSFSCPQGTLGSKPGAMLGQDAALVREAAAWVKEAAGKTPVVIKLTPIVADVAGVAAAAAEGGADGICASNTIPSLTDIDVERFVPAPDIGGRSCFSGLSGPAIKPFTLRTIAEIARNLSIPITGTGGPVTWRDLVQFMLVGCSTVQFCTAPMIYGFDIARDLLDGLAGYMKRNGMRRAGDLTGRSVRKIVGHPALPLVAPKSRISEKLCIGCGRCFIACRDGGHVAMEFPESRVPTVDDRRCVGCGLCQVVCPIEGCISLKKSK